ncbi:MAG: hypothetical protein ACXV5H_08495 [Halobacteriota archaeon]
MWEKHEGGPMQGAGPSMGKGKMAMMMMMWEKLSDDDKKMFATRMLDERIFKKELKIKYLEHKIETIKMMKTWIEKM